MRNKDRIGGRNSTNQAANQGSTASAKLRSRAGDGGGKVHRLQVEFGETQYGLVPWAVAKLKADHPTGGNLTLAKFIAESARLGAERVIDDDNGLDDLGRAVYDISNLLDFILKVGLLLADEVGSDNEVNEPYKGSVIRSLSPAVENCKQRLEAAFNHVHIRNRNDEALAALVD
jgi:hypothetical protein